jgi:DNA polymerase-1
MPTQEQRWSRKTSLRELTDAEMLALAPPGVTLVRDVETARRVVKQLRSLTHYADGRRRMHACDTEAIDVDLKEEGPIGKGIVICFSVYCGDDVDFGRGAKLFVDTLGPRAPVLEEFRAYFEDEAVWKVWHNYGFDRHALGNHGIDVRGFGGDTMHMARLWDASRMFGKGGYSLEGLTRDLLARGKTSMKDIFGAHKVRVDGTEGAEVVMPALDYLQRSPLHVRNWIDYATYDSESTWLLRNELERRLSGMPWRWPDDELAAVDAQLWRWREGAQSQWSAKRGELSMYDQYREQWRPYGELLTSMERRGIWLDSERLAAITPVAWADRDEQRLRFIAFMERYCPDAVHMNIESDVQRRQLFFAPCANEKDKSQTLPAEKEFKRLNVEGAKTNGRVLKHATFTLTGLGLPPLEYCDSGWPRAGGRCCASWPATSTAASSARRTSRSPRCTATRRRRRFARRSTRCASRRRSRRCSRHSSSRCRASPTTAAACTRRSTSTPKPAASRRAGPTCRTSRRSRRTATKCATALPPSRATC